MSGRVFSVEIESRVGLFAQLNQCLRLFAFCELNDLKPAVRLTSPLYVTGERDSWFDYFFLNQSLTEDERHQIATGALRTFHVSHIEELGIPSFEQLSMNLYRANEIFFRHAAVREDITKSVESFIQRHFDGPTLGIHFRGTDKSSEAIRASKYSIETAVDDHQNREDKATTIFVASDEAAFIEWAARRFEQLNVVFREDSLRSGDGKPVHTRSQIGDNYAKGEDALVNSLLLSRCDALIRTSSFLSAWSSVFNPDILVRRVNQPFTEKSWFPDSAIN